MPSETVTISKAEYKRLKLKEEVADDALLQLNASLEAAKQGRIRKSD